VVTGDGDALSIGGNHLIHALRRNMNLTILLFKQPIYGLTKGQYSTTSRSARSRSDADGSLDIRSTRVAALGAEAPSSAARLIRIARADRVLRAAAAHRGAALVEILQECRSQRRLVRCAPQGRREERLINVAHGQPITFGAQRRVLRREVWLRPRGSPRRPIPPPTTSSFTTLTSTIPLCVRAVRILSRTSNTP